MRQLFIFSALLVITTNVWATPPKIESVSGASAYILTGTATIFGGLAGNDCSALNPNPGTPCNSCVTTTTCGGHEPLCACNESRIYDALPLVINVSGGTTGNAAIQIVPTGTGTGTTTGTYVLGGDRTHVAVPWQQICIAMGHPSCEGLTSGDTTNSVTLNIFFDANGDGVITTGTGTTAEETTALTVKFVIPGLTDYNEFGAPNSQGIGAFSPYPGDEKIFIEKVESATGFTLPYGSVGVGARVYMSDKNLTEARPNGRSEFAPENLPIVENGNTLDKNIVDHLENGKLYFFRLAIVDQANNVVQFFPAKADPQGSLPECSPVAPTDQGTAACVYSATPDKVLGLLSKDFNCFIATAAYGTALEPKLKTFRDFRYHVLLRHSWGQKFVKAYYNYGPYAARYIYDKPFLRAVTRVLLWPLYGFSWLALQIGLVKALALFVILLAALLALPWIGVRRMSARA